MMGIEIVLAVCFFALAILVISDWLVRRNSSQDKEIEKLKSEISDLRSNIHLQQIEFIKRDQRQIEPIETALRLSSRDSEGK